MYYNNMNGNEEDLKFIPLNITEPFREKDSTWFPIIDMALPAFNEIPNSFALKFITPMDNSNLQGNTLKTLDYIQNDNSNLQNNNQAAKKFEKDFNLEYPSETLSEELFSYNKEDKCKKGTSNTNNENNNATNMQKTNNKMNKFNEISNLNVSNNSSGMNNPNTMNNPNWMNNPNTMNNLNWINNNNETNNPNMLNNPNEMNNSNSVSHPNTMNNPNGMNNPGAVNYPNTMNNLNGMNNPNATNNPNGMQNTNMKSMINNRNYMEEPIHMELLRNLSFGDYLTKSYRGEEDNNLDKVDMIYGSIKNDNSIMDTFKAYNIPKPIYQLITKKIIKITLDDENCKKGE
ncbi:hypothetical protein [Clostridium sp. HCS.1]|uniref:hypothetical protein n=1 Tax=Clostridium sp. HCS.1 TaxID=3238594 RepID=UPI003A0FD795